MKGRKSILTSHHISAVALSHPFEVHLAPSIAISPSLDLTLQHCHQSPPDSSLLTSHYLAKLKHDRAISLCFWS